MLVIRNEVSAPRIAWLCEDERWKTLREVWTKLVFIAGAIIYPEADLRDRQLETLEVFVASNPKFSRLTAAEIEHAFLLNAQGEFADQVPAGSGTMFRHYNKELNAEFVGDVLNAYVRMKKRLHARKHDDIVRALLLVEAPAAPCVPLDVWMREIQDDYETFQAGRIDWIFNTTPKYYILRKLQLLIYTSREKWLQWYRSAIQIRADRARRESPETFGGRIAQDNALSMYDAIAKSGMIQRSEHVSVMHEMRRAVYLKFFEFIRDWGIKEIFSEIAYTIPKAGHA